MRQTNIYQRTASLLHSLSDLLPHRRLVRQFRLIMSLFLDASKRTLLENVPSISSSTASRFFNKRVLDEANVWDVLNRWQQQQWQAAYQRGRPREMVLKVDVSCIEKTGKQLPYVRVFNKRQGIHIVVLHACVHGLSIPLDYRIYQGKGNDNVVDLALAMLADAARWCYHPRTVVMADAAFGTRRFITGSQALGWSRLLLGVACDRNLKDGRRLDALRRRGEQQELHDLAMPVWISWCYVKRDNTRKRFFVLATFKLSGRYLARRYRRRWLIESFFKTIKYDFGLKEARLRTQAGIRLWITLCCVACCLAVCARYFAEPKQASNKQRPLTLCAAAALVLEAMSDVQEELLLRQLALFERDLRTPLRVVRSSGV